MDEACLIIRVGSQLCALPLSHVAETMRPLTIRPVTDGPPCVCGLAVIRGRPVPVVDAAALMLNGAARSTTVTRFVSLNIADRGAALAVDEVIGIRQIDRDRLAELPPLLGGANQAIVSAVATLDGELVLVLHSGKLVPPAWALMEGRADF